MAYVKGARSHQRMSTESQGARPRLRMSIQEKSQGARSHPTMSKDAVKQYSPSKAMTEGCLHANNLQFTNRQGQENGDITQVLDPGCWSQKAYSTI